MPIRNDDQNEDFDDVCDTLDITDPDVRQEFHRYLQEQYVGGSIHMSYQELLQAGREFLVYYEGSHGR